MTAASNLLSLSGAQLRAEPTNAAYAAELARRMGKREAAGKVTVAALKSWGRGDEAAAFIAHAKANSPAKAPKAPKVAPAPVAAPVPAVLKPKAVAFTRTNERVDVLTTKVNNIEASILALASSQASMLKALELISSKLGVQA